MASHKIMEMVGKRFGRLTVLSIGQVILPSGRKDQHALCRCDCGTEKYIGPYPVLHGVVVSCGCRKKEHLEAMREKNRRGVGCKCGEKDPAKFYAYMPTICKACQAKKLKTYGAINAAKLRDYNRLRYLQNQQNIQKRSNNYYRSNKEIIAKRRKEIYERNRPQILLQRREEYDADHAREWRKQWAAKNPEKQRLYKKQDYGRRKAAKLGGAREKVSYAEIIQRDGMKCHICLKKVARKDLSFDHLIPLARGGSHTKKNIAVSHLICNVRRGAGRIPAQLLLVG